MLTSTSFADAIYDTSYKPCTSDIQDIGTTGVKSKVEIIIISAILVEPFLLEWFADSQ